MKKKIIFITLFLVANMGFSAWVVTEGNKPYIITFDEDVPLLFRATREKDHTRNIAEPDNFIRKSFNKGGMLFSEGVATSHFDYDGDGTGNGSSTHFSIDGNQNGKTDDLIGTTLMGVFEVTKRHSFAYKLARDNDWASSGLYLRIQNKTGATISKWTFFAGIYYGELDLSEFSQLDFSYAVDNNTNPNEMSFISFGKAVPVTQGDQIDQLVGMLNETVTTVPVDDGGYIVLVFRDLGEKNGSDIYIDDIGVIAEKETIEGYKEERSEGYEEEPLESYEEPIAVYEEELSQILDPSNQIDSSSKSDENDFTKQSGLLILAIGVGSLLALIIFLLIWMNNGFKRN